ncbi:hypothetical protein CAP35_09370 [Chitinophagaceae bacterium IBVUCB1]|nr:hypothetical protein CAP35_09370 [Chitinophagaceae bacterium IBVUCB1]
MKAKLTVFIIIIACSLAFASCTKYYNCECVDYKGLRVSHTVEAKTKVEARNNCDKKGNLGDCEIK